MLKKLSDAPTMMERMDVVLETNLEVYMSEPSKWSAVDAARRIAAGTLTSEALVRACLARIAEREAVVQAWAYLDPDHAIAQAKLRDAEKRSGRLTGPLHGVPVGLKDIIETGDMPTEHGSPIFKGNRPARDAACVAALREAGAVILGKTVTTELANTHPGKTRNPHNPKHTPGGSSSGSAAGVADFHMPLALGTQTGGSVIRPASFNGIYALKPTLGLISRRGVLLQSHTLDTLGVYGRSLEDLALLTDALSAHDPLDPVSYPRTRGSLLTAMREPPPAPPRFAFFKTPAWSEAEDVTKRELAALAAKLGPHCQEAELAPPFDQVVALHAIVMAAEDLAYYGGFLERTPQLLSDKLRGRLEAARAIPADAYIKAVNAREDLNAHVDKLLDSYDAILCPAACGPAPASLETTGNPVFNGLWTYLGMPCVALPLLTADGMPLGVQLVGKRGDEARLMRSARWLDQHVKGPA
jgi:Asp-tRNA(Asn)/Glu-tRNA(Gln) amidotransferase A subunit family amidase